jgi:uncharacterized membrane protein YqiK
MGNFGFIVTVSVAGFILLLILGLIFARLYTRATKERAFVRTGMGGQKVIRDGGALVLPVLHDVIFVNMNTLRLTVNRREGQALITKDRMRVDIEAEFYVRVKPDEESIATAAQTLGNRTHEPGELRALVEGKFVDVLRAVGATMTMEELHENRTEFVQAAQNGCASDLEKNGLELESVSLTGLDQTAKEHFNPDNAFDAEGLTILTRQLEDRKKIRNDIEQDTRVEIERKRTDAEKMTLEISRDEEFARIMQQRDIANERADSDAQVARISADKRRESEEADIEANRSVKMRKIAMLEETENRDIEKAKKLEIARQEQSIAVSDKSKEESKAKAAADAARADAVKAEEDVVTVRQTAAAERNRKIVEIKATEQANEDAIGIKISAEARKMAAANDAEAIRINAEAEAEATLKRAEAEAEGVEKLNAAKNTLTPDVMSFEQKMKLIGELQGIMAESMKPVEKIESIKMYDFGGKGAPGFAGGNGGAGAGAGGSAFPQQMTDALLAYRAQIPMVDTLLKEMGLDGATPAGIIKGESMGIDATDDDGEGEDGTPDYPMAPRDDDDRHPA